jgi:hypothetical protein
MTASTDEIAFSAAAKGHFCFSATDRKAFTDVFSLPLSSFFTGSHRFGFISFPEKAVQKRSQPILLRRERLTYLTTG